MWAWVLSWVRQSYEYYLKRHHFFGFFSFMLHFCISPSVSGGRCPDGSDGCCNTRCNPWCPVSVEARHPQDWCRYTLSWWCARSVLSICCLCSVHVRPCWPWYRPPSQEDNQRLLVYWLPWSELIISGAPWASTARRSTSMCFPCQAYYAALGP